MKSDKRNNIQLRHKKKLPDIYDKEIEKKENKMKG